LKGVFYFKTLKGTGKVVWSALHAAALTEYHRKKAGNFKLNVVIAFYYVGINKMDTSCILLNGDYSYLCLVNWKKAMRLVVSDKVKVLKYSDRIIRGVGKVFRAPAVLVLTKVVRAIYRGKVPFSKKNVLVRDRFTCVYCAKSGKSMTIDHVIPKSKGGKTNFDNCVACCKKCNNQKGIRLPSEARMHLLKRPYQPTISEFIRIRLEKSDIYNYLVELGIYGRFSR
jgi:5-methylcytosine-specific restriction endonuclease McrA